MEIPGNSVLEIHGNPRREELEKCAGNVMEILGKSGRRMGNVLENHANPRKFQEKNGKCAGKSWKS